MSCVFARVCVQLRLVAYTNDFRERKTTTEDVIFTHRLQTQLDLSNAIAAFFLLTEMKEMKTATAIHAGNICVRNISAL